MFNLYAIWTVARYEAKLLFRSWSFRIFSLLGLFFLFWMCFAFGTKIGHTPHFTHSLAGSLPMINIKMVNVYQGIIAAFLATEFLKRDRRHDTTQVVFTRSFSNLDYVLGKLIGIAVVFSALNIAVLLQLLIVQLAGGVSPFSWQPYVFFTLFMSIPTLVFFVGMSFLLVNIMRNQAIVFVVMLAYSLVILILLGQHYFCIFDAYAYYQAIMYSDFIGMGNLSDLIQLRGAYLFLGFSCMAATVLFTARLTQSRVATAGATLVTTVCLVLAIGFGYSYLDGKYADREFRQHLKALSQTAIDQPVPYMSDCSIELNHSGQTIEVSSRITAINTTDAALDSLLFTLNPGLTVSEVKMAERTVPFNQDQYLLWMKPQGGLVVGDTAVVDLAYSGEIDDRYCYLDIEDERYEGLLFAVFFSFPKMYSFVTPDYLHLTPEAGWYPIAGLPQGAVFPKQTSRNYTKYSLSVSVPKGLTAISQGIAVIDSSGPELAYRFEPEVPLPQMSLTVGTYELRQIEVDEVTYALYTLPDHDYFTPYFDSIGDTLSHIIREVKNEYEVALGLEYPHSHLSLVETPIQFYSYRRLWTVSQETVQPQVVYMPELGTSANGADFMQMKRGAVRRQERANQADTPEAIQAGYLKNFIQIDLLGTKTGRWGMHDDDTDIEQIFEILPNYISHRSYLSSTRWPVLNYAFESYFRDRSTPPADTRGRRWHGLTDGEKANLALKELSLADLITGSELPANIANTAIANKGRYLLSLLEAQSDPERFAAGINRLVNEGAYENLVDSHLIDLSDRLGNTGTEDMIDSWYNDTTLPGYVIEGLESYKVLDGERTRSQVKFTVANPTDLDGMIELSIRYSSQEMDFRGWRDRGQGQSDYVKRILVPAQTSKEMGIVIDEPPAQVAIETYVGQNIPSLIIQQFRDIKLRKDEQPFAGEIVTSLAGQEVSTDTVIVDNEDAGFEILVFTQENWLRRTLLSLFGSGEDPDPYVGMEFWDPPSMWMATTDQNYHGTFVHSAQYKKTGDGTGKVAWMATFDKPGDYDVYYYCDDNAPRMWRRRHNRNRRVDKGEKHFLVYHEDGIEELPLDLNAAEEGWNYLGTYRYSEGEYRVELTDKTETGYVTADAVKWVKR